MGSSHSPLPRGRPAKYDRAPKKVLESWLDDSGNYQVIPLHPDTGCMHGGASCFECKLPRCWEDLTKEEKSRGDKRRVS